MDKATRVAKASATASQINALLGYQDPAECTRQNDYFGGYGCYWDDCARAWRTILPYAAHAEKVLVTVAFEQAGAKVSAGNCAGLTEAQGGVGIQINAEIA